MQDLNPHNLYMYAMRVTFERILRRTVTKGYSCAKQFFCKIFVNVVKIQKQNVKVSKISPSKFFLYQAINMNRSRFHYLNDELSFE